jgi:hypothetical protein
MFVKGWWNDFAVISISSVLNKNLKKGLKMGITYREAKRILSKQDEARDVINSYRGMETLGKRLQLRSNKELILKLFEIEEDTSIVEVFTHLKALYEEQWGDAEVTPPPEVPGELKEDPKEGNPSASEKSKQANAEEVSSVAVGTGE